MKGLLYWMTWTIPGTIVFAILFFPLGLVWWTFMTDVYWTVGGTIVNIILILINRKLEAKRVTRTERHERTEAS